MYMSAIINIISTVIAVTFASVINYFVFRRIIKNQAMDIISLFGETEQGEEIKELIHLVSEYTKSEEAAETRDDLKTIIENVKSLMLHLNHGKTPGNPGKLLDLPNKPDEDPERKGK